jgi:hypothetical protein
LAAGAVDVRSVVDGSGLPGRSHGLGAVVDAEFGQDRFDVVADGFGLMDSLVAMSASLSDSDSAPSVRPCSTWSR